MINWQDRTEMVIGPEGVKKLGECSAAVFGLGGVGSYAAEALARAGVGRLALFDGDWIDVTNLNRQLYALRSTIGLPKAQVSAARIRDINPEAVIEEHQVFYSPENSSEYSLGQYDVIIDAIDSVTCKLELAVRAREAGTPMISCMGTGDKLEPGRLRVSDIYSTSVCPLARVMRRELRLRGVDSLRVVWSDELPRRSEGREGRTPGSISFVPPVAGMLLAAEAVKIMLSGR